MLPLVLPVIDRIRFRLLGPLRLWDGSAWTGVPAAQQRLVLAVLLSEAGNVVATDRIIDELWGEHPPKAASAVVRGYVMRLRKRLGTERAAALVTRDRGYELTVGAGEVDAGVFEGADNPAFAGRREHLDRLDELLREDGAETARPKLICITGTAGVGKSALAVRWAHRVRERFPDGQLFVNLRGFDPTGAPVTRSEAIRGFLDSLGVAPERMPLTLQARIGLYRTLMARKRILVVLDNAAQEEVVRSLLPAAPGCLVIATSREDLRGLVVTDGAVPVSLGLMSTQDARDLLGRRIGRDRVAREPHAVNEIIDRCAQLPLALSIVAARAVTRPGFSLEAVAAELRDGFDLLSGGETATDPRTVFSWSYSALDDPTARLFRLLGLHPGPDAGLAAVVSLSGLTPSQARMSLARLVRANLVAEPEPDRYTWHDLLREYVRRMAQEHEDSTSRRAALDRVTDHYLHTAHAAARLCDPMRDPITLAAPVPGAAMEHLADRQAALRWLRREHTVLLRVLQAAAAAGLDHRTGQLAWCLATYLDWQGHWADLALTQRLAMEPAKRSRDTVLWASAGRQLARAHLRMGQLDAAGAVLRSISGVGGPVERAHALFTWCMVKARQGRHAEALELAVRAHELFEANNHRVGLVRTLNLIGWSQAHLGLLPEAIEQCRRALSLAQHLGDSAVEANIWDSLGFALHRAGDVPAGLDCYERSLAILRDLGNRLYEADTLVRAGDAFHSLGHHERARAARREAIDIFESLGYAAGSAT